MGPSADPILPLRPLPEAFLGPPVSPASPPQDPPDHLPILKLFFIQHIATLNYPLSLLVWVCVCVSHKGEGVERQAVSTQSLALRLGPEHPTAQSSSGGLGSRGPGSPSSCRGLGAQEPTLRRRSVCGAIIKEHFWDPCFRREGKGAVG